MSLSEESMTKAGTLSPDIKRVQPGRAGSPVPSCQSMKSDQSIEPPLNFKGEFPANPRIQVERAGSPVPSCLSMKSDHSIEPPLHFEGEFPANPRVRLGRAGSPVPSCQSMKSDQSIEPPQNFKGEFPANPRVQQLVESSCPEENSQEELDLAEMSLKCTLMKVTDGELKDFQKHQNQDYPECHERQQDLTHSPERERWKNESMIRIQKVLKTQLKKKFECIFEGVAWQGQPTLFNEVYTELYITEGGGDGVNKEHEVRQIEVASKRQTTQETQILCNDIFKPLPGQEKHIRTVLTKGIAGIGKTVTVQKFILDWAEGKANQDIHFIFTLPFRDLNLKERELSLMQLLHHYFPLPKETETALGEGKIVFIFDGLDESRLPLDFLNNKICCHVTESASVDVLLTNLIKGNLLPSALLWITSRPAAANQIPLEYVHQVTEVRGFNDPQKEEYFRKRIRDGNMASRIISHIKSSRSLYIMCHIPVFCWISSTVLETMLYEGDCVKLPKTLTEMYTHFLLIQTNVKNQKYHGTNETNLKRIRASDSDMILKLGKLAFLQLEKGNLIFYEEDLRESGIDVTEASVYSGVCTEIFKEESGLHQEKVYCFVHLSIQEYLAALFVFHSCVNDNRNVLRPEESRPEGDRVQLSELHRSAVDQALQSKNGHLDLFLRFLLGLSLDSIQLLLSRLTHTGCRSTTIEETVEYIKMVIREESSAERTINLFQCLNEVNDNSLVEEIQKSLRSGRLSLQELRPDQCSALAFVLLMSEEVLDEFDAKTYNTSAAGQQRLVPVVRNSRKAILNSCGLTDESCEIVASVVQSSNSALRELDLSNNNLGDSGVELLCAGLKSPNCKLQTLDLSFNDLGDAGVELLCAGLISPNCNLQTLKLSYNKLGKSGVTFLCAGFKSPNCKLQTLDLSFNNLGHSGVKLLCAGLKSPNCKLQTLELGCCNLTEGCCDDLASVLRSPHSALRDLELRDNELQDSGVAALSAGLEDLHCKLQRLGLSGCRVTERGCDSLASALRSNPSHLRELDLSYNHPGDSGVRALSAAKLDTLTLLVDHGGESRNKPGPRKYGCRLTLDPNTVNRALALSEGDRKVTHTLRREGPPYPDHAERFDHFEQVLCREDLSGRCYWEAEWSVPEGGKVQIAVTYRGISRKGRARDSVFGQNNQSWSLLCTKNEYTVWHNDMGTNIPARPVPCHTIPVYDDDDGDDEDEDDDDYEDDDDDTYVYRVGVCVDRPAGTLSFYSVSDSDTLTLLHRYRTSFPGDKALCAGFRVLNLSSVFMCQ